MLLTRYTLVSHLDTSVGYSDRMEAAMDRAARSRQPDKYAPIRAPTPNRAVTCAATPNKPADRTVETRRPYRQSSPTVPPKRTDRTAGEECPPR